MKVKDMVISYLKTHNYDGLCYEDCGCGLDDLAPCGEMNENCRAAYKVKCEPEKCGRDCDGIDGWCYRERRLSFYEHCKICGAVLSITGICVNCDEG